LGDLKNICYILGSAILEWIRLFFE
jgi:hypothetical protein